MYLAEKLLMVRTLPIRVEPQPGESMHSWLCALAHRNDVTWSDILYAVGLHGRRNYLYRSGWEAYLRADERQRLSVATATDPAVLDELTLARFACIGVATGRASVIPRNVTMWRHRRGSRFCPHCLTESAGRWDLRWTLGWHFACLRHESLLCDTCSECGCANPSATPLLAIPNPTRCMARITDGSARRSCGADLTGTPVQTLPDQHPFLDTQRVIVELTDSGTVRPGVYGSRPGQVRAVLTDLSAVADYVIARADLESVERLLGSTDCTAPSGELAVVGGRSNPMKYRNPPATAREAAIGLTCAVQILSHDTVAAAGRHLGHVMHPMPGTPPTRTWRVGQSVVFTAVQLRAAARQLSAADQLRYRTSTDIPRRPRSAALVAANLARRTPALIWPDWSRHLDPPTNCDDTARAALSCAVLVAGGVALGVAADILGHRAHKERIAQQFDEFATRLTWAQLQNRILDLADHLAAHAATVDYQRRRALDYSEVLSDRQWARLHRRVTGLDTSTKPRVRAELITRVSGSPASGLTASLEHGIDSTVRSDPEYDAGLIYIATAFLRSLGIKEPVSFAPPVPAPVRSRGGPPTLYPPGSTDGC